MNPWRDETSENESNSGEIEENINDSYEVLNPETVTLPRPTRERRLPARYRE